MHGRGVGVGGDTGETGSESLAVLDFENKMILFYFRQVKRKQTLNSTLAPTG